MTAATLYADRLMLGRGVRESGIRYARRVERTSKHMARNAVVSLFTPRRFSGGLSILTMPGLDWSFERSLLANRERGRGSGDRGVRRTFITAVERNPAIWQASILRMPGADTSLSCAMPTPGFARAVTRSHSIQRFYNCDVSDFVTGAANAWRPDWRFVGAWIDLTGPLTMPMLDTLEALWGRISRHLVVTSLKARWPAEVGAQVREAGIAQLLMDRMPFAVPTVELEYADGSPMHQIVLTRVGAA